MSDFTPRDQVIETVNRLFVHTDNHNWDGLQDEVFTDTVYLDMTSLGGDAREMSSAEICQMWEKSFEDLDALNHLAGNFLVTIESPTEAHTYAYATTTHYKKAAKKGNVREFVGTYDIDLTKTKSGWRINSLVYHLKYMNGNLELI